MVRRVYSERGRVEPNSAEGQLRFRGMQFMRQQAAAAAAAVDAQRYEAAERQDEWDIQRTSLTTEVRFLVHTAIECAAMAGRVHTISVSESME
jgi:hypothetical protein